MRFPSTLALGLSFTLAGCTDLEAIFAIDTDSAVTPELEVDPPYRDSGIDPDAPCGDHGPTVSQFGVHNSSVVAGEPSIGISFLLEDVDGDIAPQFTVLYDEVIDGAFTADSRTFTLHLQRDPNATKCGVPEFEQNLNLEYSLLNENGVELPKNTRIEFALLLMDEEGAKATDPAVVQVHTTMTDVVVFCTPQADGSDADAPGC